MLVVVLLVGRLSEGDRFVRKGLKGWFTFPDADLLVDLHTRIGRFFPSGPPHRKAIDLSRPKTYLLLINALQARFL